MSDIKVTAKLSGGINATAQIANVVEIPVAPDVYTGEYNVTAPSDGELVLPTKDKLMMDDVTIEANRTLENALIQHTPLEEYRNDEVTEVVGEYAFGRCMFKKLYLPNVTTFINVSYCMDGSGSSLIEEVHLPRWTTGTGYAFFDSNPNLRLIDMGLRPTMTYMRNCANLKTLILRSTTFVNISGSTNWANSPLHPNGSGCYVYVPQALLAQYQSSQAWQQYAHVLEFRPIEGSEYELEE